MEILKGFVKGMLLALVIGAIWYTISYKVWESKGFDDNLNLSDYFEEEKEFYPQVSDNKTDLAKKLYSKINYKMLEENFGKDFFSQYYDKNLTDRDDFSSEFIIFLAVINIEKDNFMTECNRKVELPSSTVENKIKELFGNDISYQKVSFQNSDKTFSINYLQDKDSYEVINTSCSGISFNKDYIETEFLESESSGNNLLITEVAYYTSYTEKVDGSYVLNFHSGLSKDSSIIYTSNMESAIDKNKFTKYVYTFVKGSGDNYYFSSVSKK